MSLLDAQRQRLLDRPRQAGDQPVAFAELHAAGISFPAAVISELELNGYSSITFITKDSESTCACSIQNLPTRPPYAANGVPGRIYSQPPCPDSTGRRNRTLVAGA